jgi:signal transduction histidine kinase/DNA-binding response OmpR family regulator
MNKLVILIIILTGTSNIALTLGVEINIYEDAKVNSFITKGVLGSAIDSISLLFRTADDLMGINSELAEKKAQQGLLISKRIKSRENIARGYCMLGTIHLVMGKYVEADSFLYEGLRYTKKYNLEILAIVYKGFGYLNYMLEDYEQAYEYYQETIDIYSRIHQDSLAAKYKLNIGKIFSVTNNYNQALKLFSELKDYFESKNYTDQLIRVCNDIGETYLYSLDDKISQGLIHSRSDSAEFNSRLDSVEYYSTKSLYLSEHFAKKDKNDLIQTYINLSKVYYFRDLFSTSNQILEKALALADSLNSVQNKSVISKHLSDNYAALGDSVKAYYFLSQYVKFEKDQQIQKTAKNQARRKIEQQRRISETNKKLFYAALTCLLISFLLILTLYLNFRMKQKANRLLKEMDELKSKLFSNITHEFRTPLTLILGPLEEMLSEGENRNLTRHEVKVMRKNANRLLNLVNQMLDLAKLDAKSMKAELSEADFVQFFKVNVMSFTSVAEQKEISYSWSLPKEPIITFFDEDKVEKIINNLISNALKYCSRGGEVKCGLELIPGNQHMVKFYVSDSGKGIRKEHLAKIFDRFYQVEGMSGSDSFGTGIGLSLTKELLTFLHGEITAESEWGTGSKFTVTLPLGTKHFRENEYILIDPGKNGIQETSIKDISPDEELCFSGDDLTVSNKELPVVLTVEDQADIRNYISKHLKEDFRIMEAGNGLQGFETAIKYLPDLIVTDLIMPEMNGIELCRKLKTDERTSHIPIIMLTARSAMEDKLEGLETGADQYLTKPFHMKEFKLLVKNLIEQRKKLRERFSRDVRLEPRDIAITSADEKFLNRALGIIETHMGDFDFEVNIFQKEMAMSRMQLFRKIKALTNLSPTEFIRTIRLKRAVKLIEQSFGNMAQISYEIGFNNPSYFAKCFKEMYGCQPSDYKKSTKNPK